MEAGTPKPGWYTDPQSGARQRWWDGSAWTEAVRPGVPTADQPGHVGAGTGPTAPDRGRRGLVLAISVVAVVLLGGAGTVGWWLTTDRDPDPEPAATAGAEPADDATGDVEPDASAREDLEPDPPVEAPTDPPADPPADEPRRFEGPPTQAQAGPLEAGLLLPQTGYLAHLEPMLAGGLELAARDIDTAGGVLGEPIRGTVADDGGETQIALASSQFLLDEGAHVIVGPLTTGLVDEVARVVTDVPVMQCSGGATGRPAYLDPYDGYFMRTVPADDIQADAIAELLVRADAQRIAVIRHEGRYGRDLTDRLITALAGSGISVEWTVETVMNGDAPAPGVLDAIAAEADATVMLTFDEGVAIIDELIERGLAPETLFASDALQLHLPDELLAAEAADGLTLVRPLRPVAGSFVTRLPDDADADLASLAATTYDCLLLLALAAEAAGSTHPTDIRNYLPFVTGGDVTCEGFAACADLLRDGIMTDYRSATGDRLRLNERNQPDTSRIEVLRLRAGVLEPEEELLVEDRP